MEPEHDSSSGPVLFKVYLRVRCWSNSSSVHKQPLVDPSYLTEIEEVLRAAKQRFDEITLPGFPHLTDLGADCRLLDQGNLFERRMGVDGFKNQLRAAVSRLGERWDQALAEARQRLGSRFRDSDYPKREGLQDEFGIDFEFTGETVELASLLPPKKSEPDPVESMFEAVKWARELEKARGIQNSPNPKSER